jgi:hypothetical protein
MEAGVLGAWSIGHYHHKETPLPYSVGKHQSIPFCLSVPGRDGFDESMHVFTFSQVGGMCLEWGLSCSKVRKLAGGYSFTLPCGHCETCIYFVQCDRRLINFEMKVKGMCLHLNPVYCA